MAAQTRRWPIEVAAVSLGVVLSAAVLALALSFGLGPTNPGAGPLGGTRVLTILPGSSPAASADFAGVAGPGALTVADVDSVARAVPDAAAASRLVSGPGARGLLEAAPQAQVEGVDPAYVNLWSRTVAGGSFFSTDDALAAARVAVLGPTVATSLFPDGQSPLGQTIRIGREPFTVVGVLNSHLLPGAADSTNTVLVPFQTAQVRLFGRQSVYALMLQARDATQAQSVSAQVKGVLRQRHKLGPGQTDDFTVLSQSDVSVRPPGPLQSLLAAGSGVLQFGCLAKGLCRASG